MATEYFGDLNESYISERALSPYSMVTKNYSCTKNGPLVNLSCWCKSNGGTPGHLRMALYASDGAFICQGSGEITVSATSFAWANATHTEFVDSVGSSCSPTLSSGTEYKIAWSSDSTDVYFAYSSGSNGDTNYKEADYTSGFPSSIGSGWSPYTQLYAVRFGVGDTSGLSIPVAQAIYRRRRI